MGILVHNETLAQSPRTNSRAEDVAVPSRKSYAKGGKEADAILRPIIACNPPRNQNASRRVSYKDNGEELDAGLLTSKLKKDVEH